MSVYYNENDPYCAQWLRNLIKGGFIADGTVDDRSIKDVRYEDIMEFDQCHFFAGIGGWSYALRSADWSDNRPIWTGSCPCQPFSRNGVGDGFCDNRHLWPDFFRLIKECRPVVIVGEQVASPLALNWFDRVCDDLEEEAYSCRALDIPACAVDAPHIRHRLYWIAKGSCYVGKPDGNRWSSREPSSETLGQGNSVITTSSDDTFWTDSEWIKGPDGKSRRIKPGIRLLAYGVPSRVAKLRALGNAIVPQVAAEVIKCFMEIYNDEI